VQDRRAASTRKPASAPAPVREGGVVPGRLGRIPYVVHYVGADFEALVGLIVSSFRESKGDMLGYSINAFPVGERLLYGAPYVGLFSYDDYTSIISRIADLVIATKAEIVTESPQKYTSIVSSIMRDFSRSNWGGNEGFSTKAHGTGLFHLPAELRDAIDFVSGKFLCETPKLCSATVCHPLAVFALVKRGESVTMQIRDAFWRRRRTHTRSSHSFIPWY